ncbi:conserved domain protein [delta proteobacterium NaphS2]|nr:conserved domain protein [delta proteobacterium NaphS2]
MLEKEHQEKEKGLSCPSCGSFSVQGGFVEIEAGRAYQRMSCTECDAKWRDVYELTDRITDDNL